MQAFAATKTILVVDDCEPICELIQILLVQAGYEVHTSINGGDALRIAQAVPELHLTICSTDLQDMRPEECVEECAHCHPRAAILFLSDSAEQMQISRPFTVLDKPFTVIELRSAVEWALRDGADEATGPAR